MKEKVNYSLNIHSRNIAVTRDGFGNIVRDKSLTGHFYLSLQNGQDMKFYGKYPTGIETEREQRKHKDTSDYSKELTTDHVFTKKIRLTAEQYESNGMDLPYVQNRQQMLSF